MKMKFGFSDWNSNCLKTQKMIYRPADGGDEEDEENVIQWPCSACTYLNHPLLKDCEQVIVLAILGVRIQGN